MFVISAYHNQMFLFMILLSRRKVYILISNLILAFLCFLYKSEIKITFHSFAVSILIDGKITLLTTTHSKYLSHYYNLLNNVKFFIEQNNDYVAVLQDNTVHTLEFTLNTNYWHDAHFLTSSLKNIQRIQKVTIFADCYHKSCRK